MTADGRSVSAWRRLALGAAFASVFSLAALSSGFPLASRRESGSVDTTLPAPGAAKGFNVVVITLDTTRADRLGCYGYARAQTPALDGLAERGIRFADAIAHTPITQPSHASIFTGLLPPNHGVRLNGPFHLDAAQITLAERLKDRGYQTAAFVSSFVLDARFGFDQGFDVYDDVVAPTGGGQFGIHNERSAGSVTDAAIRWFGDRDRDRPFFAWVHYFDPHEPYAPPPPFSQRFEGRPYDGEIAYMDSQLGRLLKAMRRSAAWRNTLIVVVGDHGESLGEHQEPSHSLSLYDATQRVPLIVSCASLIERPLVIDDVTVAISDVFPTVLSLLGGDQEGRCDGVSLLEARRQKDRVVYLEALSTYFEHGWAPLFGLRRHHDKFILAPTPEYFDLRVDPRELESLFAAPSDAAKASIAVLRSSLAGLLAKWPTIEELEALAVGADLETTQRLESLGYVSGASADGSIGSLDPKDMIATWTMLLEAQALTERGRLDEALAMTRQAQGLSPRDRSVFQRLGDIYSLQRRYDLAEKAYRDFNDIMPNADVCVMLAQMVMVQGRLGEVEQVLKQAQKLEPRHGGVFIVRGDVLSVQGRIDDAIRQYERAIQLDPYRATEMASARIRFAKSKR